MSHYDQLMQEARGLINSLPDDSNERSIVESLVTYLGDARELLVPFAAESLQWILEVPDAEFPTIVNNFAETDDACFTVGDLRAAAVFLDYGCSDEGCPEFGSCHTHYVSADDGLREQPRFLGDRVIPTG